MHVPAVLQRFTRFVPGFVGHMVTQRDHVPVLSARSCRAGGSVRRYMRPKRRAASRGAEMSSHRTP